MQKTRIYEGPVAQIETNSYYLVSRFSDVTDFLVFVGGKVVELMKYGNKRMWR